MEWELRGSAQESRVRAGAPPSRLQPPGATPNTNGRAPRSGTTPGLEAGEEQPCSRLAAELTQGPNTSLPLGIALFSYPSVLAAAAAPSPPHQPFQHSRACSPGQGILGLRYSHGSLAQNTPRIPDLGGEAWKSASWTAANVTGMRSHMWPPRPTS